MEDRGYVGTMVSDGTGDAKENTGGKETCGHIHLAILRGHLPCADLELGLQT